MKREFVDRWIECEVAKMLSYRVVSMQVADQIPNYEASMCKLFTQRARPAHREPLDAPERHARPHARTAPRTGYMQAVSSTIAGGTSEIQKGIIATRGLGLPAGVGAEGIRETNNGKRGRGTPAESAGGHTLRASSANRRLAEPPKSTTLWASEPEFGAARCFGKMSRGREKPNGAESSVCLKSTTLFLC